MRIQRRHAAAPFLALICLALLSGCMRQPLGSGSELPPLRAAGWTNGDVPGLDGLSGKVIVLEVFATW